MTFWARKLEDSGGVEVNVTHGPVRVAVVEDPGHLRHFWGELGRLLDEAERGFHGAHEVPGQRPAETAELSDPASPETATLTE